MNPNRAIPIDLRHFALAAWVIKAGTSVSEEAEE